MTKRLILFLVFLFLFSSPVKATTDADFSPDEIIVKFKNSVSEDQAKKLSRELGAHLSKKLLLEQTFTVKVPEKQIEKFIEKFNNNPLIEYAEPDFQAEALVTAFIPNDSYFDNQWGMIKIQAPEAWDINKGSTHSVVAITDTGIDNNHEDLETKIDKRVNFTTSQTDDDLYGHGTHVAGIAASVTNNNLGVAGVGYEAHLLSVKVLNDQGSGYYSWIINGIKWAADNGARVINLSLGGSGRSKALEQAVNYAFDKGILLSCAAGNAGNKSPTYPAYYKNCLAVAATDENDKKAGFSSFGSWVDVAAPGVNIFSTFPNHPYKIGKSLGYDYGSGTSMATPHVAGLAGLLFGVNPVLTSAEVRGLIENNTDKITGTGTYWLKGRINAYRSITAIPGIALPAVSPSFPPSPTPTPIPTPIPSPTPSSTLTPTPNPSPSTSPNPSSAPTPKPWWCSVWLSLCD